MTDANDGRESAAAKFEAARRDAERAADAADRGNDGEARETLASVVDRLERLVAFLTRDDGRFSAAVVDLLVARAETATATAEHARSGDGTGTPMPTETAQ